MSVSEISAHTLLMAEGKIAEQSVGQYGLEQLVGQDAFADTYLAYDSESRRQVLITVLGSIYAEDEVYHSRYLSRAKALSQIRHPNIATIYDSGETDEERPYVVSEQIAGFPLADRLQRLAQQLSPAHAIYALTLVRQIASGLSLAERLGFFHYALAPRHILLRNVTLKTDGSAILINLDILPSETLNSDAIDDPQLAPYLSPEQLNGKDIDGRSHVYSLGVMLFQLLTGQPPDQSKPNWQKPLRKMSVAGAPIQNLRDDLAPETYDLVDKSLRLRPGGRYGSIDDFVSALDRALAAEDLRIHTSDLEEPRRPRPIYLAPILLLLLCVSLAAAMWWFNPGNSDAQSLSPTYSTNASGLVAGVLIASPSPTATPKVTNSSFATTDVATSLAVTVSSSKVSVSPTKSKAQPTATLARTSTPVQKSQPTITPSEIPPTLSPPTATVIIPTRRPTYVISVGSASLRRGPSTRFDIDSYILQDETVVIIGKAGRSDIWYVVETTDGRIGWISASVGKSIGTADLASVLEAVTIPAPPPTFTSTPTNTPIPTATDQPPSSGNGSNKEPGNKPKSTPTPPL